MTTTLTYYAHLFPNGDKRFVEQMERIRAEVPPSAVAAAPRDDAGIQLDVEESPNDGSWPHFGPNDKSGASDAPEAPDLIGGPWRTRTSDPLIKSLKAGTPAVYDRPRKAV